jgi:hypothetical protein
MNLTPGGKQDHMQSKPKEKSGEYGHWEEELKARLLYYNGASNLLYK